MHDNVIPELAGAGLSVETIRTTTDEDLARLELTRAQVLDRLHGMLSTVVVILPVPVTVGGVFSRPEAGNSYRM